MSAVRRRASTARPRSSPPSSPWPATATACGIACARGTPDTGADAARVRLAAELEDGLSSMGAAPIGLELLALRERRVVASGGLGSDSRVSAEERRRVPGAALLAVPIAHEARARPPAWSRCCGGARASSTTPTWRSPSACAWRPRPRSSACSWRRRSGARARRRASCSASARCSPPTSTARGAPADRGPGREPARRRRLRAAPAGGGRARPARGRGRAGGEPRRRAPASATCSRPRCSRPPGRWPSTTWPPTAGSPRTTRCSWPGFASWAGAPIASADGGVQGMLAIFGRHPRRLRDDEVEALAAFANSASVALRNALLYEAVADEKDRVAAILGRVADAIVATDADGRVVLWNAAAEQITQIPERRASIACWASCSRASSATPTARRRACSPARARSPPRCGSRAPARSCGCRSPPPT